MNTYNNINTYLNQQKNRLSVLLLLLLLTGCGDAFLEARPDKALLVPSTLADFRALLDNSSVMNVAPYANVISSDEFSTTDAAWASASAVIRNSYTWQADIYEGGASSDWNTGYEQIFYSNVVLDGLGQMDAAHQAGQEYARIKGTALFLRTMACYHLSQEFTAAYDEAAADQDMGIPLRLSSDVNLKPGRGTLRQTYGQMLADLRLAADLLPEHADYKTRPSQSAAWALLARICLIMGNLEQAKLYADRCIAGPAKLLDYNSYPALETSATKPFPRALPNGNEEVLFFTQLISASFLTSATTTVIDPLLVAAYKPGDRRKAMFFVNRGSNVVNFKGTYAGAGQSPIFAGLALDEVYLVRAECYARGGNAALAMDDLNALLETRWDTGTYVPLTAADAKAALKLVLAERKKELVFRGIRWSDLKRLNKETEFAVTLQRVVKGNTYELAPGSARYVFPIPDNEIAGNDIPQNKR